MARPANGVLECDILERVRAEVERACAAPDNSFGYGIWTHHIVTVVRFGRLLSERLGADPKIVELAALLHDYAGIRDAALVPEHHRLGDAVGGGCWARGITQRCEWGPFNTASSATGPAGLGAADTRGALHAERVDRNMDVILDLVVNHTSSAHPWFVRAEVGDARYRAFYSFRDDDPGWRGLGGPAWHPSGEGYYLGLFWSEMPDLNFRNPEVERALEAGVQAAWVTADTV